MPSKRDCVRDSNWLTCSMKTSALVSLQPSCLSCSMLRPTIAASSFNWRACCSRHKSPIGHPLYMKSCFAAIGKTARHLSGGPRQSSCWAITLRQGHTLSGRMRSAKTRWPRSGSTSATASSNLIQRGAPSRPKRDLGAAGNWFERSAVFVNYCRNPAGVDFVGALPGVPEELAGPLGRTLDLLDSKTRQRATDENIEANILLAEENLECPRSGVRRHRS